MHLLFLLVLMSADNSRMESAGTAHAAPVAAVERPARRAERASAAFEKRYNDLVEAVARFAADYNGGRGGVWPEKKAEALRRAIQSLAECEPRLKKH